MKSNLKQEYKKIQKKEKIKTILKWVFCGVGWTSLLLLFVSSIVLGTKSCRTKKQEEETMQVLRNDIDYRCQTEELPYKYYYRYEDKYLGYTTWATPEISYTVQFDLKLKYKSSEIEGDNGYYRNLKYFQLNIMIDGLDVFFDLFGSETNENISISKNALYSTYYDGRDSYVTSIVMDL